MPRSSPILYGLRQDRIRHGFYFPADTDISLLDSVFNLDVFCYHGKYTFTRKNLVSPKGWVLILEISSYLIYELPLL